MPISSPLTILKFIKSSSFKCKTERILKNKQKGSILLQIKFLFLTEKNIEFICMTIIDKRRVYLVKFLFFLC